MADTETDNLTTDQKLAAIDHERATWDAELASLPAREQLLLENDAGDDAFASLDRVKRRAEIGLAKLDVRERAVLQQARQDHDAELVDVWAQNRARYQLAAKAYADAVRTAQHLELELRAVGLEVNASGTGQAVPQPIRVIVDASLQAFMQSVDAMPADAEIAPPEADQHALTLLDRHLSCNAGETVLLTAAAGWPLVDANIGRWASGTKPPRRPVLVPPAPKSFWIGV
ncbi:MAG: hypothetical protein ACRYHQ_03720 [Janthinobacterium lividum]